MYFFQNSPNSPTTAKAISTSINVDDLPTEILWRIFYFSTAEELLTLSRVNKALYRAVTEANDFWKEVYELHFPTVPANFEGKLAYQVFLDTYAADYPDLLLRRCVFLVKGGDYVNLDKVIHNNKNITTEFFDVLGKLTGKTLLDWAKEGNNQGVLDCLFQLVDNHYQQITDRVCSNAFVSSTLTSALISAQHFLERPYEAKDFLIDVNNSVTVFINKNKKYALQGMKVKRSHVAIAEHHRMDSIPDRNIEIIVPICIELHMMFAAAKAIVKKAITDRGKINYPDVKDLLPILELRRIQQNEQSYVTPESEVLYRVLQVAKNAAYTALADEQGATILYWAIYLRQSPEMISQLLDKGSSLYERYFQLGFRPLHVAAELGHKEIVELLLQKGAEPSLLNTGSSIFTDYLKLQNPNEYLIQCFNGYREDESLYHGVDGAPFECKTPVHMAAEQGHAEIVVSFIKNKGACTVEHNSDRHTPIHVATIEGRIEVVRALLTQSPRLIVDDMGISLLNLAVENDQLEVLAYLVKFLTELRNATNQDREMTPLERDLQEEIGAWSHHNQIGTEEVDQIIKELLTRATNKGRLDIIEIVVRSIYETDPDALTSILHVNPQVNALIDKVKGNLDPEHLLQLVKKNKIKNLNQILSLEMFDNKNEQGETLFNRISQMENNQLILDYIYQLALKFYTQNDTVNTKMKDSQQRTILYWAITCHQSEKVIKNLLDQGSETNEKYLNDFRPLHVAALYNNNAVIPTLINMEGNTKASNMFGQTPMHIAIEQGNLNAVGAFIRDNTLVNRADNKGRTPLHIAAKFGQGDIIRLLNNRGAALKAYDSSGMQPIHIAVKEGKLEALKELLKHGDLLEEKDKNDRTPLAIALEEDQTDLAKHLITEKANLDIRVNGKTPFELAELNGDTTMMKLIEEHSTTDSAPATKRNKLA